jgi:hypothetical protein
MMGIIPQGGYLQKPPRKGTERSFCCLPSESKTYNLDVFTRGFITPDASTGCGTIRWQSSDCCWRFSGVETQATFSDRRHRESAELVPEKGISPKGITSFRMLNLKHIPLIRA